MTKAEEYILERFAYSEEHCGLVHKLDAGRWGQFKAGTRAGCLSKQGGRTVSVPGTNKPESNVVWFMHHNEWPKGKLNHINGDPSDNRIGNLFLASRKDGDKKGKRRLTMERLKYVLSYDHLSGVFTWKGKKSQIVDQGQEAGFPNDQGYILIGVDGVRYRAHRLAWLYCYGQMPNPEIDHINGNRADNRIYNLRLVSRSQNSQNSGIRSDNTSGVKGVHFRKDTGKYSACIQVDGKVTWLGCFLTLDEAIEARKIAEEEYHPFRRIKEPNSHG